VRCSAASLPKEEEWEKMGGNRHAHYEKELGEGGFRPGVQQKGWGHGVRGGRHRLSHGRAEQAAPPITSRGR
jgi:hypothetical protein